MSDSYKKFYETDLWQDAFNLQKEVFNITKNFSSSEIHGLISQINRSTNSVCANIAESHGRYHFADKVRVLYISRGEIEETQSHLIVSNSRNLISKELLKDIINKYENLKMKLNKYISTLMNSKNQS